jgi:hypothetical protein
VLSYFHLAFLPDLLYRIHLTTAIYSLFSDDLSFFSSSPLILVFLFVGRVYTVISCLSSKRFISNKVIRKVLKKIRKHRMCYMLIHDAFWVC